MPQTHIPPWRHARPMLWLLGAVVLIAAAGCSRSSTAKRSAHSGGSAAAAAPIPSAISCFSGARAYRFSGTLALTGDSQSNQIGSLANLLKDVRFRGAVKQPDASSISLTFPGAGGTQDLELRRVGGQLYERAAGGAWQTSAGQGPIVSTISRLDPQGLCQSSLANVSLGGRTSTVERVNGVDARRYTLGSADLASTPGLFGEGGREGTPSGRPSATLKPAGPAGKSTLDVWVDPLTAFPVKMRLNSSTTEAGTGSLTVTIDITGVNATDIAIPAPTP